MLINNLNKIYLSFSSSLFIRNVSTLLAGSFVSQVILFAFTPLLTRLFSPVDFGFLAIFTSISTIAATISTGRYELAIGLPPRDTDAAALCMFICVLGAGVSLFLLLVILFISIFAQSFALLGDGPLIYMVPVFTFFSCLSTALVYWNHRKKQYRHMTLSALIQVCVSVVVNLIFGYAGYTDFGLIVGLLSGQIASFWFLYATSGINFLHFFSWEAMKHQARKYISFPKYMLPSDFLNTTSLHALPLILSIIFNATVVGFISLATRVLRIPTLVIATSITNVFRNSLLDAIREHRDIKALYLAMLSKMALLSLPILGVGLISPWFFPLIFGVEWLEAGSFAQIICWMLALEFIVMPLNSLFYILGRQKIYLALQVSKTVANIIALIVGYLFTSSAYISILLFAFSDIAVNAASLYFSYSLSAKRKLA